MVTLTDTLKLPCGATLDNRLCKAAMTEGLADSRNFPTSQHDVLYRQWTGPGLLLTGNIQVDRRYLERPGNVAIEAASVGDQLDKLKSWAQTATTPTTSTWVQLSHAGRQTLKIVAKEPVGPSAIGLDLPGGQFGVPRALSEEEIEDVIERFAFAAQIVKSVGFGGVQVHGAHGYLISSFLNPRANQRTDQWGGSLENRARLLVRVVQAVRLKVGSGFPVSLKLNSSDFQKGGFSFDECLDVIRMVNDLDVDLLEISGGSYEQPKMMDIEGIDPAEEKRASTKAREAYFLDYAEEVRSVATMPLMVSGGFRSRTAMDAALASGATDMIGMARPFCVTPDLSKELLTNETAYIEGYEKTLRVGGGYFGPTSSNDIIRALNGVGATAFYYRNINRLADGKPAKTRMNLLAAYASHMARETRMAKAL